MIKRLLLAQLALTLFVVAILVIPLGVTFADHERDTLVARLERDAYVIGSYVEERLEEGSGTVDPGPLARQYATRTGARVVIVGADGVAVVDTEPPEPGERIFRSRPEIERALTGDVATGERHSTTLGLDLLYVAVPVASSGTVHGAVRLSYPTTELDGRVRRTWLTLAGVGAVSLLATALVGLVVARSVTEPVRRVRAAAARLGGGRLDERAPAHEGPPEIRELAADFNDMAARLEELVGSQEAFVADASHQLRSPLTALRLRLEVLEGELAGTPEAAADVAGAITEVQRMSRIVDGLLALARPQRESADATAIPVDALEVLDGRRAAWFALAAERDLDVVVDVPSPVTIRATPDRLVQVLDNLIANAIDAAPPGSRITLRAADGELHVIDEGRGMTPEQRSRALDRFWRGPGGDARLGGSGLGLAIVDKLVRADGGDVALEEAPGGGLDAVVRLRTSAE